MPAPLARVSSMCRFNDFLTHSTAVSRNCSTTASISLLEIGVKSEKKCCHCCQRQTSFRKNSIRVFRENYLEQREPFVGALQFCFNSDSELAHLSDLLHVLSHSFYNLPMVDLACHKNFQEMNFIPKVRRIQEIGVTFSKSIAHKLSTARI